MQYGSTGWQEWVLDEKTAIEHIKFAWVQRHKRIFPGDYRTHTKLLRSYEHGIQTFDTANVGEFCSYMEAGC